MVSSEDGVNSGALDEQTHSTERDEAVETSAAAVSVDSPETDSPESGRARTLIAVKTERTVRTKRHQTHPARRAGRDHGRDRWGFRGNLEHE